MSVSKCTNLERGGGQKLLSRKFPNTVQHTAFKAALNLQKKKFENMVRVFNYEYSTFLSQNKEVINFFDSIKNPKIHKVYSYRAFCNEKAKLCNTHDKNNFFFFDGYHPSLEGAKMINDLIMKKINLINKK